MNVDVDIHLEEIADLVNLDRRTMPNQLNEPSLQAGSQRAVTTLPLFVHKSSSARFTQSSFGPVVCSYTVTPIDDCLEVQAFALEVDDMLFEFSADGRDHFLCVWLVKS